MDVVVILYSSRFRNQVFSNAMWTFVLGCCLLYPESLGVLDGCGIEKRQGRLESVRWANCIGRAENAAVTKDSVSVIMYDRSEESKPICISHQKYHTAPHDDPSQHHDQSLCHPPTLNQRRPPTILLHRLNISRQSVPQAKQAQDPKHNAHRQRHALLQLGGLRRGLKMEGYNERYRDDAKVH